MNEIDPDLPWLEKGQCPTCHLKIERAAVPQAFQFGPFTGLAVLLVLFCSECKVSHSHEESNERARLQALALLLLTEPLTHELLAAVRVGLQLSQKALGDRLGLPAACIGRWESGRVLLPDEVPLMLTGLVRERLIGPEITAEHKQPGELN